MRTGEGCWHTHAIPADAGIQLQTAAPEAGPDPGLREDDDGLKRYDDSQSRGDD